MEKLNCKVRKSYRNCEVLRLIFLPGLNVKVYPTLEVCTTELLGVTVETVVLALASAVEAKATPELTLAIKSPEDV